jgi:hypothetical protein
LKYYTAFSLICQAIFAMSIKNFSDIFPDFLQSRDNATSWPCPLSHYVFGTVVKVGRIFYRSNPVAVKNLHLPLDKASHCGISGSALGHLK